MVLFREEESITHEEEGVGQPELIIILCREDSEQPEL